ncbi:hypothetical protein GIB67_027587 [Kingdonia uniflora]|uniref:Homeobox domain-containing protein n=1 Tax=Kingdonia uniflora TaxID=39325 RepID=A0A7J7NKP5_9MAGN|nr:hypothetical protein GIB67_027587 [Kingdonia uniflora]
MNFEGSMIGMNNYRSDSHVAQQRRRDKLRVAQNIEDISSNCDFIYDPAVYSSETRIFSIDNHVMHQQLADAQLHRSLEAENVSFATSSNSSWKGVGTQQSCDWIMNCVTGGPSSVINGCGQTPLLAGKIAAGTLKEPNISSSPSLYMKPNCNGYQNVQSSFPNPVIEVSSNQDCQKQFGEITFNSPPYYPSTLQEVVNSSSVRRRRGVEMASHVEQNNELVLLPNCGNQANVSRVDDASTWIHRPVEGNQWDGELGFAPKKRERGVESVARNSTTQGLSLSLSSNPPSESNLPQFGGRSENLQCSTGISTCLQDLKMENPGNICSSSKSIINNPGFRNSVLGVAGSSTYARRATGPLGPFTGYAIVLKTSKFLKPAQKLLQEFCNVTGQINDATRELSKRNSRGASVLSDYRFNDNEESGKGGNSEISYPAMHNTSDAGGDGGSRDAFCQLYRPELQQKKQKLLYIQDEVRSRYRQYYQQKKMVASSFESVAGLSAATPYTSLAWETVSRKFRFLSNLISDQLRQVGKVLGEELSSTGTSTSCKVEVAGPRLRFIGQNLCKYKTGGEGDSFLEPQHKAWRPQRGLPERAVAVLRAWLFEHFLHPYPTDSDKHMLASQTGLTRNQVSNWFINARVRVWKPMVEEMHTLETKDLMEMDLNSGEKENPKPNDNIDGSPNKFMMSSNAEKQPESSFSLEHKPVNVIRTEQWFQEKRSRLDYQVPCPSSIDGTLMGYFPYHHGGLGAVSLTLGLRQGAENAQLQQQKFQQAQEHQQLKSFGGHMRHDFVG